MTSRRWRTPTPSSAKQRGAHVRAGCLSGRRRGSRRGEPTMVGSVSWLEPPRTTACWPVGFASSSAAHDTPDTSWVSVSVVPRHQRRRVGTRRVQEVENMSPGRVCRFVASAYRPAAADIEGLARSPRSSSPATMERPAAGQAATTRTCGCALSTMGSGSCPLSPRSCCRSTAVARPPEQPPVSRQPSGRAASRDRMGRALSDKVVTSRCTHAVRAAGVEDPPELRPGRWTRR
jgi:hypothetical protein